MTIDLYPAIVHDLSPDAIGEEIDAVVESIDAACKGFGTDELGLIKAIVGCTPEERVQAIVRYKETHKKDLKAVVKSECGSRDFGTALQLLSVSPAESECEMIKDACKGLGTDELLLYPIVCGRSNIEMKLLKTTYYNLFEKDLAVTLDGELGGDFERLIFHCLQGAEEELDPDFHNDDKVAADVEAFYNMGQGKWGTDEAGMFKLLCSLPAVHLQKVNEAYAEAHEKTLFEVMKSELGGKVRDATLFLLGMKLKPYETIAELIKKACKGLGTNEMLLSCTLIRYQICLKEVMAAYSELYGGSLQELLQSETGGDYRKLLIEMCNAVAE